MAQVTRTIIIKAQAGQIINFRLVDKNGKAKDAWDTFTGEFIPSVLISVVADENGDAAPDLWPTSRATMEIYYLCSIQGAASSRFIAPLMDGPGVVSFAAFKHSSDLLAADLSPFMAHVQDATLHVGYNKVVLVDSVTGLPYRLVIEDAALKLMELAPGNYGYIDYILQDYHTGTRYRLVVDSAQLKLEEI